MEETLLDTLGRLDELLFVGNKLLEEVEVQTKA